MKNQIILEYLEQLDLSDIEAKLYLTLLETGPVSVRELAAKIDIKRTTAYLPIEQLIEKGLIMKVVKGANKLVAANDPKDSLEHLVKKKLQTAQSLEEKFQTMIDQLTTALPPIQEVGDSEIKFYKGVNGVKKIYEEVWKSKELRSYANLADMERIFPDNVNSFNASFKQNKEIKILEILENSPASIKQTQLLSDNERYQFKFLPNKIKISSSDILIYDGKVAIVNARGKITGIILYNKDYYNLSKELFNFFWETLPVAKR